MSSPVQYLQKMLEKAGIHQKKEKFSDRLLKHSAFGVQTNNKPAVSSQQQLGSMEAPENKPLTSAPITQNKPITQPLTQKPVQITGANQTHKAYSNPIRSSSPPKPPSPATTTKIPRPFSKIAYKRNTGLADSDGLPYTNTDDVILLNKLGYTIDENSYMFLPRGEGREGLYTYIEKNAGIPKSVTQCIDEGTAFSGEYLKDMDYEIPKGYEIKGDLCCPVEKTAFELNESPEKTASDIYNNIVIENPKGSKKEFGKNYPIPVMTYPVDYGYLPGYTAQDDADLDFFKGTAQKDGLHGSFDVWRPDVKGELETKFYTGATEPERDQILKAFQKVIRGTPKSYISNDLMEAIKHFAVNKDVEKTASTLVVSGIHGDEPAGDVAAEKLKGTTDVISDINPTDKRRFRGKDINRHFDKPVEGSIQQKLLDIIDSKRPSRVVALHEDDEVDKPYAYSSPSLAHEVKEALKDKDTATSAHNDKTDDGVISEGKNPPKGSLEKALDNRGIAHATIETPSKSQNMGERTKTHLDVIKSLLAKEAGEKPGLWANIRAKKARGEKAAKPGSEDYPDKKQWDKLTKQAMTPEEFTLKYMSIVRAGNRGARRYQAAIGAGAGGVVGGAIGGVHNLINPGTEVDPDTGETVDRSRLKSALGGALKGLGIGAGIGGGIGFSKGHIEREKAIRDLIKNRGNTPASAFDPGGLNYIEDQVLSAEYNKHPELQVKYRPLDDTISNKLNSIYDKIMGKKAAVAAWQRSEGKNPEGGLNAKGRASYKKETGGTLKAPVTESNPSGERAKRQNSFCSRMCGMKRKNTGSEGQSNPDSRINKSLRKWNCKCGEAHESLFEKVACMLKESKGRCWEGYEPVPGKEAYSEDSCRPKGKKKESELEKEAVDAYELRKLIIDASRGCRDSKQALSIMGSKGKGGKLKSLLEPARKAVGESVQGAFPFDGSHQMEIVKKNIDPSYIVDRSKYLGR